MLMILDPQFKIPENALKEGDKAPIFKLPLSNAMTFELYNVLKSSPVMLHFIKGTWCPFCRQHMRNVRKWMAQLNKKVTVLIVSNESIEMIKEWQEKSGMLNLFASDPEMKVIEAFGLKLTEHNFAKPATFLIDVDGSIRMAYYQKRTKKLFKEATESLAKDSVKSKEAA